MTVIKGTTIFNADGTVRRTVFDEVVTIKPGDAVYVDIATGEVRIVNEDTPLDPGRWKCGNPRCHWVGKDYLTAPDPFNPDDVLTACPECREAEHLLDVCDVAGCTNQSGCGFPSPRGYRRTCGKHASEANWGRE